MTCLSLIDPYVRAIRLGGRMAFFVNLIDLAS